MLFFMFLPFLVIVFARPVHAGAPSGYRWPVEGRILRGFEKPTGAYGEGGHQGVDIAAATGERVHAAGDGVVAWVGEVPRGKFVSISHSGGVRTCYLDVDGVPVSRGARVGAGQVIASVAGGRDSSCHGSHLHFDASINGMPVDPRLLMEGLDSRSYIRLCPVEKKVGGFSSGRVAGDDASGVADGFDARPSTVAGPGQKREGGVWNAIRSAFSSTWNGIVSLGRDALGAARELRDRYVYKGLAAFGRAFKKAALWVWHNRWVQGIVAGVAAVVAVVAVLIVLVVAGVVTFAVALVAAAVAALAALAYSICYTATHHSNFNFLRCFLGSLTSGGMAAGFVVSAGTMSSAFSAGWAELGLGGTIKTALVNGLMSAGFDGGFTYLTTGRFEWKNMLIAFGIGVVSGALMKVLKTGLTGRKILEVVGFFTSEGRLGVVQIGGSALLILKDAETWLGGIVLAAKDAAITVGSRVAYAGLSGTLGVGLNAVTCALTGKPITFSGCFSSFLAGATMGMVALSFGGEGIGGLLEKLGIFKEGAHRVARGVIEKLADKSARKALKSAYKRGFEKLLGEEDVSQ